MAVDDTATQEDTILAIWQWPTLFMMLYYDQTFYVAITALRAVSNS